jgi:hypothetical protein
MQSRILTGLDCANPDVWGSVNPLAFKYRILVEGDSWMDRGNVFEPALTHYLAPLFDKAKQSVLFINLARFGDTMAHMGGGKNRELELWLKTQFPWKFDAMLISGGGNDYIDSAADSAPGQGLLLDVRHQRPTSAQDCVDMDVMNRLRVHALADPFSRIHRWVQSSPHAGMPMLLNTYDMPTARDAPAVPGGQSWLHRGYVKNGVPGDLVGHSLYGPVTRLIFDHLRVSLSELATGRRNVHLVETVGTLTPARPGSKGPDGDWVNEIHPSASGWKKLAPIWFDALKRVL